MSRQEWIDELEKQIDKKKIRLNVPMCEYTSFCIGGPASVFIQADTREELTKIISFLGSRDIPYFILGNGSNLLVSDKGYRGVILTLGEEFKKIEVRGTQIRAGAGAGLRQVCEAALEASLSGLEFASGIPGSLGGGVVMNAGAYGGEMSHILVGVCVMDREGDILYLDNERLELGYRTSIFKRENYIALEAILELQTAEASEIKERMEEYDSQRVKKQPLEYPSAGSTFKRPKGHFAGKLIMDAGLRGFCIGGAQVSEKHCGFVINRDHATAEDVRLLMKEVQNRVKEKFGVELEPEVIFLGEY